MDKKLPPNINIIPKITTPEITTHKISPEITAYSTNTSNTEISQIIFHFNKGIWQQKQLLTANLTSKLIIEGTKNKKSTEIANIFDFYGASFSSKTSLHATSFKLIALNKFLPTLIPLTIEILTNPSFPKNEFIHLKNIKKQNYLIDKEEISIIAHNQLEKNIFGKKHPYGYAAKLKNFDKLKIQWIKQYYNDNYTANNLSIIITSNNTNEIITQLQKEITKFKQKETSPDKKHTIKHGEKFKIIKKENTHQTALKIGWKLFDINHNNTPDMIILNTILGGYFSSRLMQNIRQKLGLTYSIYSSLALFKYSGSLQIASEINKNNTEKVIQEIKKEIKTIQHIPPSETEMNTIKNYTLGSIIHELDGPFNYANAISTFITYNLNFNFYNNFYNKIINYNPTKISEIANKYLTEKNMFTVIVE